MVPINIFIASLLLGACYCLEPTVEAKIIQQIGNQMVEQHEIMELVLDEYFMGQLLTYELVFSQGTWIDPLLDEMIYMREPLQRFREVALTNTSMKNIRRRPFPGSTYIMEEYTAQSQMSLSMSVLTRDMQFISFNISGYTNRGDINKLYEVQVNTSLINAECRDIFMNQQYTPYRECFYFFCRQMRDDGQGQYIPYISVVIVNRTAIIKDTPGYNEQVVREYTFPELYLDFEIDFDAGFQWAKVANSSREDPSFKEVNFHLASTKLFMKNQNFQPSVMAVDFAVFEQMAAQNITWMEGPPIVRVVQQLSLIIMDVEQRVISYVTLKDVETLPQGNVYMAFAVRSFGVAICQYDRQKFANQTYPNLKCELADSQVIKRGTYIVHHLYKIPQSPLDRDNAETYFYGICSRPPAILEFDFSDINNVNVHKIYRVEDPNDQYTGTGVMAVNKNYVLHLLVNLETERQTIRVFNRNSNYFSAAKFEILVPRDTYLDFFHLPNILFNVVVFRDECSITVSAIVNSAIVLDGRNNTLIDKFKDQKLKLYIFCQNSDYSLSQTFNVEFVTENETAISLTPPDHRDIRPFMDVFYNCGERQLDFVMSSFFNGPNYNLTIDTQEDGRFFKLENQDLRLYLTVPKFNASICPVNFLFMYQSVQGQFDNFGGEIPTIMVCIDTNSSIVRSFTLRPDGTSVIQMTNKIQLPEMNFVDFAFDPEHRTILALAEQPLFKDRSTSITRGRYEIHVFTVQNEVLWRNMIPFSKSTNITLFSYNSLVHLCVFIEFNERDSNISKSSSMEIIRVFPFNFTSSTMGRAVVGTFQNATFNRRIVKAQLSSEHVVFSLTADKRILVFSVSKRIELIREILFDDLVNFDVFDNIYFVVYRSNNIIEVYTIDMLIYLQYHKRLTFYSEEYSALQFKTYRGHNEYFDNLVRTYRNDKLSFLMVDPRNASNVHIFVHCMAANQHSSFILTRDLSEQFLQNEGQYTQIIMTWDDTGRSTIGVMSNRVIKLYDAIYDNRLSLNEENGEALVQACRGVKLKFTNQTSDPSLQYLAIDTIGVKAQSLFNDTQVSAPIKMAIKTQNQGMAVTSKSEKDRMVQISIANDSDVTSTPFMVLHETYIEGQALSFSTQCSYKDRFEVTKNCTSGMIEESRDVPYQFPIELVSSTRSIVKSFTMGKLFFMFDSMHELTVFRLPLYQQNLDSVDMQALINIYQESEEAVFGCRITGFTDYYPIPGYDAISQYQGKNGTSFMLFYHCAYTEMAEQMTLNMAIVQVYPFPSKYIDIETWVPSERPFTIQIVEVRSKVKIPYSIIDLELFNLQVSKNSQEFSNTLEVMIAVSCKIEDSYSNMLAVFSATVYPNMDTRRLFGEIDMVETLSASTLVRDTYFVTKLLRIPKTELIIAVIEDTGAHIMNLTRLTQKSELPRISEVILSEISVIQQQQHLFRDQAFAEFGELQVHTVTLNLPNTIHLLTNYGLYVFDFSIDLASYEQIHDNDASFKPLMVRPVLIEYDHFQGDIASNKYGSSFLLYKKLAGDNYMAYLAAISYYSAPNSRLFKMIPITMNEECISLNMDSYYEYSPEDQIAVSFICNQYLMLYRVCMRPHVVIHLSEFANSGGDKLAVQTPGTYQYNEFNITITGYSLYSESKANYESVHLTVHYQERRRDRYYIFIAMGLIVVSLLLYLLFYVDQTVCKVGREEKEKYKGLSTDSPFQLKKSRSNTYTDYFTTGLNRTMTLTTGGNSFIRGKSEDGASIIDLGQFAPPDTQKNIPAQVDRQSQMKKHAENEIRIVSFGMKRPMQHQSIQQDDGTTITDTTFEDVHQPYQYQQLK